MDKLCWYWFGLWCVKCIFCCWILQIWQAKFIDYQNNDKRGMCTALTWAVVRKVQTRCAWAASRKEAWSAWWAKGRLAPEWGKAWSFLSWFGKKQSRKRRCHYYYCIGRGFCKGHFCLSNVIWIPAGAYIKLMSSRALYKGWLSKAFIPLKWFDCMH